MVTGKVRLQRLHVLFGRTRGRQLGLLDRDHVGLFIFQSIQNVSGHLRPGRRRSEGRVQGVNIPGYEFEHCYLHLFSVSGIRSTFDRLQCRNQLYWPPSRHYNYDEA